MNAYDIAREERIENLRGLVLAAQEAGDKPELRRVYNEYQAALLARSPEQVERLEQKMIERVMGASHGR